MKLSHFSTIVGVLVGGALLNFTAAAAKDNEAPKNGWYFGGSGGRTIARTDDSAFNAALASSPLTATSTTNDKNDVGLKIFVGKKFDKYIAVELGFFRSGEK